MKKITILMLCLITIGLASCQKEVYQNNGTSYKTIIKDISTNAWQLSLDGFTYSVSLPINEIDRFHIDNEGTLVYISYNGGTTYTQLPFVYNVDAYSYEVYQGGIAIDIQRADYQQSVPQRPTGTVRVKVVLLGDY